MFVLGQERRRVLRSSQRLQGGGVNTATEEQVAMETSRRINHMAGRWYPETVILEGQWRTCKNFVSCMKGQRATQREPDVWRKKLSRTHVRVLQALTKVGGMVSLGDKITWIPRAQTVKSIVSWGKEFEVHSKQREMNSEPLIDFHQRSCIARLLQMFLFAISPFSPHIFSSRDLFPAILLKLVLRRSPMTSILPSAIGDIFCLTPPGSSIGHRWSFSPFGSILFSWFPSSHTYLKLLAPHWPPLPWLLTLCLNPKCCCVTGLGPRPAHLFL